MKKEDLFFKVLHLLMLPDTEHTLTYGDNWI